LLEFASEQAKAQIGAHLFLKEALTELKPRSAATLPPPAA
jgi:hypothetical protein